MTLAWQAWLAIAAGGAAGGVLRHLLSAWVAAILGTRMPWGTLAVNLSGAFAIGVVAATPVLHTATWWPLLVIGLLGSYTTVSSFSLQSLVLMQQGAHGRALANILLSVLGCLAAALAGMALVAA